MYCNISTATSNHLIKQGMIIMIIISHELQLWTKGRNCKYFCWQLRCLNVQFLLFMDSIGVIVEFKQNTWAKKTKHSSEVDDNKPVEVIHLSDWLEYKFILFQTHDQYQKILFKCLQWFSSTDLHNLCWCIYMRSENT